MDEQNLDAGGEGEAPIAEQPPGEAELAETPVAEAPAAEAPAVEAPVVEAPAVEAPAAESPGVEASAEGMTEEEAAQTALEAEDPEAAMAAAMAAEMGLAPDGMNTDVVPPVATSAASFEELGDAVPGSEPAALALLYDLDLPVAIELGRTRLSVQDVLALGRGSVVQLDRQAGEPVDVFVGDRRFAEAEVVIVGEQFGVRITRILTSHVPVPKAKA